MIEFIKFLNDNTGKDGAWEICMNGNKTCYEKPSDFYKQDQFISDEEMIKCDDSDTAYELTWYKDTPVGHFVFVASSLEALSKYVMACKSTE